MNGDFAVKFIWACAFLFPYSLAREVFLLKIVKMDLIRDEKKLLDQSKYKRSSIFALSANTFRSYQIKDGC